MSSMSASSNVAVCAAAWRWGAVDHGGRPEGRAPRPFPVDAPPRDAVHGEPTGVVQPGRRVAGGGSAHHPGREDRTPVTTAPQDAGSYEGRPLPRPGEE